MIVPAGFDLDPRLVPLSDVDINNGLVLLQRWVIKSPDSTAGRVVAISVQTDPGDSAKINQLPAYRTLDTASGRWKIVDFDPGDGISPIALARVNGYLIEVTAPNDSIADQLINTIGVNS